MERLTNKDWHKTKFMGFDEREVLHRLWELENALESQNVKVPKFKVSDEVYFIRRKGFGATFEEALSFVVSFGCIRRIYKGKKAITYYLNNRSCGIREEYLYKTEEEANKKANELNKNDRS